MNNDQNNIDSEEQEDEFLTFFETEAEGYNNGEHPLMGNFRRTFNFAPVPYGNRNRHVFVERVHQEMADVQYVFSDEVRLDITLYLDELTLFETSERADLDNYAKIICDSLKGINGILTDDTQIHHLSISRIATPTNPHFDIEFVDSPDNFFSKPLALYEMPVSCDPRTSQVAMLGILLFCLCFEPGSFEYHGGEILQLAVRPLVIVVVAKRADPDACFSHRGEDMQVQALVTHRAIETLILAILPGLARLDILCLHATLCQPSLHGCRHKLCPIVAAQMRGRAMQRNQHREHTDHALGRRCHGHIQRQSLAREFVDHGQDSQRGIIGQGILHKITGPDMAHIGRLHALWAQSPRAFPHHAAHL